jgi:hypothetical protein
VANLTSSESAVIWATSALSAKKSLVAADANLLEKAFEQKLSGLSSPALTDTFAAQGAAPAVMPQDQPKTLRPESVLPKGIDKSVLTVAAPRRYRNREHLRYVAQQACLVCGRKPSDPHHLRHVQPRALGRRASDEFAVPLCRVHHREVHRAGNERAWWQAAGVDPVKIARKLWNHTCMNEGRIRRDKTTHGSDSDRPVSPDPDGNAPA